MGSFIMGSMNMVSHYACMADKWLCGGSLVQLQGFKHSQDSEGRWQPPIAEWTFTRNFFVHVKPTTIGSPSNSHTKPQEIATGKRERKWEGREKGRGECTARYSTKTEWVSTER